MEGVFALKSPAAGAEHGVETHANGPEIFRVFHEIACRFGVAIDGIVASKALLQFSELSLEFRRREYLPDDALASRRCECFPDEVLALR